MIGVAAYVALIAAALWTLLGGLRSLAPGLGRRTEPSATRPQGGAACARRSRRIALAAAFCALLVHTIGYAGYLTDPLTWSLIAIGAGAGARPGVRARRTLWRE